MQWNVFCFNTSVFKKHSCKSNGSLYDPRFPHIKAAPSLTTFQEPSAAGCSVSNVCIYCSCIFPLIRKTVSLCQVRVLNIGLFSRICSSSCHKYVVRCLVSPQWRFRCTVSRSLMTQITFKNFFTRSFAVAWAFLLQTPSTLIMPMYMVGKKYPPPPPCNRLNTTDIKNKYGLPSTTLYQMNLTSVISQVNNCTFCC